MSVNSIERADKAKAILESPIYQEAHDAVRTAIIERIERCPLTDSQTAEDLRRCLKLLKDVRLNLEVMLNHGKVERFNLAKEQERAKNPLRNLFR
jgi:hypothetical protein